MTDDPRQRTLEHLGAVVQGVVLGTGLFLALCKMLAVANEAHVFRYQGF